jgi:hypothetical protein
MTDPIGPLTPADEGLCHQIVDTFAIVSQSDMGWTEKVCAMAMARDGSMQLGFGLGKYTNRNVIDAYAGASRGVEQILVRASRRLSPDPELTVMGPIRYEVVEPLKKVRFVLEPNEVQPIAFDWLFEGDFAPEFEHRGHIRQGYRTGADLVRYHQIGRCSGWLDIDGERIEMTPETWVSTRDHSWGVRYGIGQPRTDVEPRHEDPNAAFHFFWTPSYLERPNGSSYGIFMVFQHQRGTGYDSKVVWGTVEHPDGSVERMTDIVPELAYDPVNRRMLGGRVHCTMDDGSTRTLQVEVMADTGFHLGGGLYFGLDGHYHGEWRGALHVDGDRIDDCSTPENAQRLHQIRDTAVRITDPTGGGVGWGNWQPMATGDLPELGLTGATSFV